MTRDQLVEEYDAAIKRRGAAADAFRVANAVAGKAVEHARELQHRFNDAVAEEEQAKQKLIREMEGVRPNIHAAFR